MSYSEWGSIFGDSKLLVIDEMGYLPLDEIWATIFFQLVSARYDHRHGDPIIDRLLHHSTTINIRGESYRLKERRRVGLIGGREQEGGAAAPPLMTSSGESRRSPWPRPPLCPGVTNRRWAPLRPGPGRTMLNR